MALVWVKLVDPQVDPSSTSRRPLADLWPTRHLTPGERMIKRLRQLGSMLGQTSG
jgi:hypothetical protein